jgi:hypothetical protein
MDAGTLDDGAILASVDGFSGSERSKTSACPSSSGGR